MKEYNSKCINFFKKYMILMYGQVATCPYGMGWKNNGIKSGYDAGNDGMKCGI